MKRQFLFGTVLAAAMAVGVGAQTPDPASPQTPPASPTVSEPDQSDAALQSIHGCEQRQARRSR